MSGLQHYTKGSGAGRPRWTEPFLRVGPIELVDFGPTDIDLTAQCGIVTHFMGACMASLDLVQQIEPALYHHELHAVRQYYVVVCLRFRSWAEKQQHATESETLLEEFDEVASPLLKHLQEHWTAGELTECQAGSIVEGWIFSTIFHPVLAALAPLYDMATAKGPIVPAPHRAQYNRWLKATEGLRPTVVLLNITKELVATTNTHWKWRNKRFWPLEVWEKKVRGAGVPAEVQGLLRQARTAMVPFSTHGVLAPALAWEEALEEARAAVQGAQGGEDSFARHCGGQDWLAVRAKDLHAVPQCRACQIKYASVHDLLPTREDGGTPLARRPLGDNWDKPAYWQYWQCAENEMFAQLWWARESAVLQERLAAATATCVVGTDPQARAEGRAEEGCRVCIVVQSCRERRCIRGRIVREETTNSTQQEQAVMRVRLAVDCSLLRAQVRQPVRSNMQNERSDYFTAIDKMPFPISSRYETKKNFSPLVIR